MNIYDLIGRTVTAFQDFTLAPRQQPWSASAAKRSLRQWASSDGSGKKDTIDWPKYRRGFLMYDSEDPEKFGSYKLPIARVTDGDARAVSGGIFAAAVVLQGGRGGVEEFDGGDIEKSRNHLDRYYAKMRRTFDDDKIVAPWARDAGDLDGRGFIERELQGREIPARILTSLQDAEYRENEDGSIDAVLKNPIENRRCAEGDIRAIGADTDEVEMSFSSEKPVDTFWRENEILSHEPGDFSFKPLRTVGSVLKNHDRTKIVGRPIRAWCDDKTKRGKMTFRFGTTRIAKEAKQEAMVDKSLRGVSVGYRIKKLVYLRDSSVVYKGRIKGPAFVGAKWSAHEVSLTPVPTDDSVGLGRSTEQKGRSGSMNREEMDAAIRAMFKLHGLASADADVLCQEKATIESAQAKALDLIQARAAPPAPAAPPATPPAPPSPPVTPPADPPADGSATERERSVAIVALCGRFGMAERSQAMITDGRTLEDAQREILVEIEKRSNPQSGSRIESGETDRQKRALAMGESIMLRAGVISRDKVEHGGQDFAGYSMMELARDCLTRAGISTGGMDKLSLVARALEGPRLTAHDISEFIRAGSVIAGSTGDFPLILAATAHKSLLDAFRMRPQTWRLWCGIANLGDFKVWQRIKFGEFGDLELVPEGGTYPSAKVPETQEQIQLSTFGKIWSMTRQGIINDDLSAFSRIPANLGRGAARKPNELAVTVLLSNPTLRDGIALFSTDALRVNLSEDPDKALDTLVHAQAGIQELTTKIREKVAFQSVAEQEKSKKAHLGLEPRVVLLPSGNPGEFIARAVLRSAGNVTDNKNVGVVNPVAELNIAPVVEPSLKDTNFANASATAYYMFADPREAPVVEVAFLNGVEEPFMEETDQTNPDGREFKVRLDTAAAVVDHTGAAKETGVAAA